MRHACTSLACAALLAAFASAALAQDGESWRPATNKALEYEVWGGRLWDLDGATLSLRRQSGEHAAWRFGLDWSGTKYRDHTDYRSRFGELETPYTVNVNSDAYAVGVQLSRLTFPWPERRLRPWVGAAFRADVDHQGFAFRSSGSYEQEAGTTNNRTRIALVALAGVEYALSRRFAIHAQYGQGAQYSFEDTHGNNAPTERTGEGNALYWYAYSARTGLAVFW